MQTLATATQRRDKALKHMGDLYLEMNAPFNENNYEDGFIMDAPDHIIGANKPDRTYVVCAGFAFYVIKRHELEEFARGEKTIGRRYRKYDRNEREAWSRVIEEFDWGTTFQAIPGEVAPFTPAASEALNEAADAFSYHLMSGDGRPAEGWVIMFAGQVRFNMSLGKRWTSSVTGVKPGDYYRYRELPAQNTKYPQTSDLISLAGGDLRSNKRGFMKQLLDDALDKESAMEKLEKSVVEACGSDGEILGAMYGVLRAVGHDWTADTLEGVGKQVFSNEFTEEKMEANREGRDWRDINHSLEDLSRAAERIESAAANLKEIVGRHKWAINRQSDCDRAVRDYISSQNESEVE